MLFPTAYLHYHTVEVHPAVLSLINGKKERALTSTSGFGAFPLSCLFCQQKGWSSYSYSNYIMAMAVEL